MEYIVIFGVNTKLFNIHFAKDLKNLKNFQVYMTILIAGGQPCNISIKKNLLIKGKEKRKFSSKESSKSKKSKTIHYIHNYKSKLNSSIIFIYHLKKLK